MEAWPSERVGPGGMYHPARVNYSPETKKFLQELMQESKLTMMQRKKINYSLRLGEPLPPLSNRPQPKHKPKQPEIIVRSATANRRQLSSIVDSGAYEPERYVPMQRGVDRDFAKKHLQDFMAYGKELKESPKLRKKKVESEGEKEINRFEEIKKEIQERIEWLADMEKLGEGHKYKILMEQQIAARLREMERLKPPHTETGN